MLWVPWVPSHCSCRWLEQDPFLAMQSGAGTLCCPLCHLYLVLLACWKPQEALTQPPKRAGREQGSGELMAGEGEVALVSSLIGKAETLIHSASALGDSAALPPAPMGARHPAPPQLHPAAPKAKPGCHSLGHPFCAAPPALAPQAHGGQPGPSGNTKRGCSPPASTLESISPLCSPMAWGCGHSGPPKI